MLWQPGPDQSGFLRLTLLCRSSTKVYLRQNAPGHDECRIKSVVHSGPILSGVLQQVLFLFRLQPAGQMRLRFISRIILTLLFSDPVIENPSYDPL